MKLDDINKINKFPCFEKPEITKNNPIHRLDPAIESYATDPAMGYQLNSCLRNSQKLLYPIYKLAKALDTLFYSEHSTTSAPIKVYRGISYIPTPGREGDVENIKNILNCANGETTFIDKGFVSTSTSLEVAKTFAGENGVVMEINLPAGTKYIDVFRSFSDADEYHRFAKTECEYLLPRNSKFKILGKSENGIIKAEYMGEVFPKDALVCNI